MLVGALMIAVTMSELYVVMAAPPGYRYQMPLRAQ